MLSSSNRKNAAVAQVRCTDPGHASLCRYAVKTANAVSRERCCLWRDRFLRPVDPISHGPALQLRHGDRPTLALVVRSARPRIRPSTRPTRRTLAFSGSMTRSRSATNPLHARVADDGGNVNARGISLNGIGRTNGRNGTAHQPLDPQRRQIAHLQVRPVRLVRHRQRLNALRQARHAHASGPPPATPATAPGPRQGHLSGVADA